MSPLSTLIIAVCLSMLLSSSLRAQEIKAGMLIFPPYFVDNGDLPPSGIYLDLMEKTLKHAGLEYHIETFPPKRLYLNLGSGETDLYLGVKGAPEYKDKVLYSNISISKIQMRVYATGDTHLPTTKEEINNHKISTIRGYSYGGLVSYFSDPKNNIDVALTGEHLASFQMLKNNRVDYVINYKHPSESILKNLTIPNLKYTNLYSVDIYFIVSKSTPNAAEVLQKLERSYLELIELGEVEYIKNDA
jgi:polar amino acid transport system substrate-binding protein